MKKLTNLQNMRINELALSLKRIKSQDSGQQHNMIGVYALLTVVILVVIAALVIVILWVF